MEKPVIVGVELTEQQDRNLRVEAAKLGLSKRKLAAQIIVAWLEEHHVKTLREILNEIIEGIASKAANTQEKNKLLDTVSSFIDNCTELVSLTVKEDSTGIKQDKNAVRKKIKINLDEINEFCFKHNITLIPVHEIDNLAFDIMEEFKP